MAIARDASSPADLNLTHGASNDDPTGTTGSFTPPLNSIITVALACDAADEVTPTATCTNTGFTVNSGSAWTLALSRGDADGANGAYVAIFRGLVTASAAGTVTVTVPNMGATRSGVNAGKAYIDVWTGADTSQAGAATNEGDFITNTFTSNVLTTTRTGSQVVVIYGDWNATGSAAPTTSQSGTGFWTSGVFSGIRTYQSSPVSGTVAVAGSFDAQGTGATDVNWCALEVLATAGGGSSAVPRFMNVYRRRRI